MAAKFVRIPFYKLETEFNEKVLKKWKNEINIYHTLPSSPNLVTLYGYCVYGGFVITFMEYMDMSIQELYKRYYMLGLQLSNILIGAISVATINAIHSLKTKKILHRDIKPQNILINKKGEIKLCDFGVSKLMENSLASTVTGTIPYWPPEYFKYDTSNPLRYNTQPDVWSLGVTLAEIGCPSWPFIDVGEEKVDFLTVQRDIVNLTKETIKSRLKNDNKMSEDLTSFILECLKPINERPTVEKLMESEFYLKYKEVNSEKIKIILEQAQVWDNITQILTKRMKKHSIDSGSLELLLTKNEKEFLSLFDMSSQPIMDLLNLFKDAVKEYKNCLDIKIKESDTLFKGCFLSVQLIRRLYAYAIHSEKPLTFDLELAVLFGQLISEAPKFSELTNFIIITLRIMCFNASKQEMFLVMDTGCVEKILLFIENDMVLSRLYDLQNDHNSVSMNCLSFLALLSKCPRESIVRFLNNKGLDLLFLYLQVPELNLLITEILMILIGNLLVIISEDVLPKIEEHFPIVLIYIQKKCRRTCSMMVNFLKKCDSLCFNTKLNLEYVNILLIEKICSWKLTEYANLSVSNVSVQLENTLLFNLKAVQLYWLWVTANDVIAASQRDYHCHKIVENGAIEIMKTLLSDKRSTRRVNELAGLILSRIEQWQNGEDFRAIFKKAEEIDTCDINDAYTSS